MQKKYRLFIFDLDGTLIDSVLDLTDALNYTFETLNVGCQRESSEVRAVVGNGSRRLILDLLPEGKSDLVDDAYPIFLEYYSQHCSTKTVVFNGVREFLEMIKADSTARAALLTNKPTSAMDILLGRLNFTELFDVVVGADTLSGVKPDPIGINHIVETLSIPKSQTVMIGDAFNDIEVAKRAGVASIGIEGGLGRSFEYPDMVVQNFKELLSLGIL